MFGILLYFTACCASVDCIVLSFVSLSGPLRRIQQLYKSLGEKLVAKKVAAEMFQRDALSFSQLESIQTCKNPCKAASKLLDVLLQLKEDEMSVFECFLETLKITNQQHIFLWISHSGNAFI
jgi:hypothetical protein